MRIMFAGTSSDVGKTTTVLAVMRALKLRGLKVQGYKAGPDYIDTAFHTFATGVKSRNLDPWMMPEDELINLMAVHDSNSDISIMEGVMGMYDGVSVEGIAGSSAALAKLTKTPVILIINGQGVALSAAAMVLGFKNFEEDIEIAGVIVNKVSGQHHYNLIKEGIEKHVGIPCVGYLKHSESIALSSRHLGLIPSVEVEALDEKMDEIACMAEETLDLDLLLELAGHAHVFKGEALPKTKAKIKLAVALDDCFNFYYEDNFDLLKSLGCELVKFSPLKDEGLPQDIDGLYIGGGFPEVFAKELSENITMKKSIKEALENNLPTYAECGGYMYLSKAIVSLEGQSHDMVGFFQGRAEMTTKLQNFGYVSPVITQKTILGDSGTSFKGHEFHRSKMVSETLGVYAYDIKKTKMKAEMSWQCGEIKNNCLGAYAHVHFYSNKKIAENLVETCLTYKREVKNES